MLNSVECFGTMQAAVERERAKGRARDGERGRWLDMYARTPVILAYAASGLQQNTAREVRLARQGPCTTLFFTLPARSSNPCSSSLYQTVAQQDSNHSSKAVLYLELMRTECPFAVVAFLRRNLWSVTCRLSEIKSLGRHNCVWLPYVLPWSLVSSNATRRGDLGVI